MAVKKTIAKPTPAGNRAQRRIMVKTAKVNRRFDYAIDDITLDFTLRVDNTEQLVPFLEILQEAVKDVEAEIAKHK